MRQKHNFFGVTIFMMTLFMLNGNARSENRSTVQILSETGYRVFEILDSCENKRGVNLINHLAEALVDKSSGKIVKVYQYPPRLVDRDSNICIGKCEDGFEPTIYTSESDNSLLLSCIKASIENR